MRPPPGLHDRSGPEVGVAVEAQVFDMAAGDEFPENSIQQPKDGLLKAAPAYGMRVKNTFVDVSTSSN